MTIVAPSKQKAEAAAPLVLGIVGTALGGTALALGLYNTYQHRKLRNEIYYGDDYYYGYDNYNSGYYAPASYSYASYDECYGNRCYYYDDEYNYY